MGLLAAIFGLKDAKAAGRGKGRQPPDDPPARQPSRGRMDRRAAAAPAGSVGDGESPRNAAESEKEIRFEGDVVTATGGALGAVIPAATRGVCVLFDTGVFLVSSSHKVSPLVSAVVDLAKARKMRIDPPIFVTPEKIRQAYAYADRRQGRAAAVDDSAYRRKIEAILEKGAELNATDIHVDVGFSEALVQFGIDNEVIEHQRLLAEEGNRILGVIFNNAEGQSGVSASKREPQSAMLSADSSKPGALRLPRDVTGVRCQWITKVDGRYLVMRLHFSGSRLLGSNGRELGALGFSAEHQATLKRSWRTPGGIRIIAAPTNEGKTTTWRVVLNNRLAEVRYRRNCLMLEDPAEGGILGARQVLFDAAHGDDEREKAFGEVIRAILRLAPDILFLGEVRDIQSGQCAFRLGLVGRQVYTTIHVYNALAIPKRLRDLGLEDYLVYDHKLLTLLCSQRLVRCLCPKCRVPARQAARKDAQSLELVRRLVVALSKMDRERRSRELLGSFDDDFSFPEIEGAFFASGEDCPDGCSGGRGGRTVVAEVIQPDAKLMRYLRNGEDEAAEAHWLAPDGLCGAPMLWHALDKVRMGMIAPEDVEEALGPLATEAEVRAFFTPKVQAAFEPWLMERHREAAE